MGREWEGVEEGEVSLRVTWDQGGRDPVTARRVSKKVKGIEKGSKGICKGNKKSKGTAPYMCVNLYMCI